MGALVTEAEEIRDELTPGANTATRVGTAMVNQATSIENSGQPIVWLAVVEFDGTNNPSIFQTISNGASLTVVPTRVSDGLYRFSSESFTSKTVLMPFVIVDDNLNVVYVRQAEAVSGSILLQANLADGTTVDLSKADIFIKIEVYP
jgi:hypothetical protein